MTSMVALQGSKSPTLLVIYSRTREVSQQSKVTAHTKMTVAIIKDFSAPFPPKVLVRVELATICGSDLHTLKGARKTPHPCVLGHEGCGEVVATQRREVKVGERVTWGVCASCNSCFLCSLGLENKCVNLLKCGQTIISSASLFGTYTTHVLCRPGTPIVPLPPVLTPKLAAPINCALATMVHALSKVPPTPKPGQHGASIALIQGAGMLGMYGAALLKEAGFTKVFCVDINRSRLGRVVEFGGIPVHPDHEEELVESDSVDVVIEVCGNKNVIPQGVRALRTGGTYVLLGLVHPDSKMDITAYSIIQKCLTIVGVHNYTGQHLKDAVGFLTRNHDRYPFNALIGPTYPLSEFRSAVDVANSGQFFRVAINPHQ
ncbi:5-exo-hydroxycamphor dehydrogenase-like [Penaeus japonicus]|uniref:5-exo-hydroxycamphor dehydrogenase-like n=1 Tax=Penaeus japonicus TaxID=27405 RepID=UPI001C715844|nr:5-exo-hydroxycamphor dehydrogenase-like [Penaeus japonicus]